MSPPTFKFLSIPTPPVTFKAPVVEEVDSVSLEIIRSPLISVLLVISAVPSILVFPVIIVLPLILVALLIVVVVGEISNALFLLVSLEPLPTSNKVSALLSL